MRRDCMTRKMKRGRANGSACRELYLFKWARVKTTSTYERSWCSTPLYSHHSVSILLKRKFPWHYLKCLLAQSWWRRLTCQSGAKNAASHFLWCKYARHAGKKRIFTRSGRPQETREEILCRGNHGAHSVSRNLLLWVARTQSIKLNGQFSLVRKDDSNSLIRKNEHFLLTTLESWTIFRYACIYLQ
jgi:hypothetical protein